MVSKGTGVLGIVPLDKKAVKKKNDTIGQSSEAETVASFRAEASLSP